MLAAVPKLYQDLVGFGSVNLIIGLLNLDNSDIAIDAVTLLHDLTDANVIEDNNELVQVLVDALIENNVVDCLYQTFRG